ncbi:MAG: type II toxin-antitoxin system RelE/ParE family toxin [Rubrivivax sp.]|nr:type II toxin-antitoxin system RelE/ParE family toxin [Rubrivivax sp.]
MNRLTWRPMALADRDAIMVYIAQDNPVAAIDLDLEFEAKAENARLRPKLYKPGRVKGTREIVVRPNYVMVYRITGDVVEVLRVLHAAQQWP